MCKKILPSRFEKAFFSFDAAFAMVICAVSFAGFSLLLSSAAASASTDAASLSSSLLALRFSSHVLSETQGQSPEGTLQPYSESYEISLARLEGFDLRQARISMGRDFVSVRAVGGNGEAFFASDGQLQGETYCVKRLALLDGHPARLEVCIS